MSKQSLNFRLTEFRKLLTLNNLIDIFIIILQLE
jgi:hypothetical protein